MRVDEDFYRKCERIVEILNRRDAKRIRTNKTKPYTLTEITGWIAEDLKIGEYVK
jgi:hypothetical protein